MKLDRITFIKAAISTGLIILVVTRIDLHQIQLEIQHLSIAFIIFALIYYTSCQWLSCWRWRIILQSSGHSIPTRSLLSSYFAGMFLNIFLPSALGGDIYRVYRVAKLTQDSEVALVSVFLERFTGLAALSALALLGLPPAFKSIGQWDIILLLATCAGSLVGAVLLITSPKLLMWFEPLLVKFRLGKVLARFTKVQLLIHQFSQHRQALVISVGLSFLLQVAIVYYHYLIAYQLKIYISYLDLLVFVPIVAVISLLPISLGGIGVKEGLWIYLLNHVGVSVEKALLLSLTTTVLGWLLSCFGAVFLFLDFYSSSTATAKQRN